jgi:oligo-1,6-glucosidase
VSDPNGYSLIEFKKIYTKWDSVFAEKGWGTIYLGNHDQPRMVTRWGNDDPAYREASSKMLTTFLMTMRATPYYYFGDELGMNNIKFDKIEDYNDIETINHYQAAKKNGEDVKAFIEAQKISARDNGRTPFQWDATANAGFTTGNPWLKVNPNYKNINFGAEVGDMNSCLSYFKKIVKLRKSNKILVYGKYQLLDKDNPKVYAYIRTSSTEKWLVLLNFSKDVLLLEPKKYGAENRTKIISNYATEMMDDGNIPLQPYEAKIYKLN